MGELIYCPFCRKEVEPNERGWCSICDYDLPSLKLFWTEVPPKAVTEPVMETEPKKAEESEVMSEFDDCNFAETEAEEVVSIENLLSKKEG